MSFCLCLFFLLFDHQCMDEGQRDHEGNFLIFDGLKQRDSDFPRGFVVQFNKYSKKIPL